MWPVIWKTPQVTASSTNTTGAWISSQPSLYSPSLAFWFRTKIHFFVLLNSLRHVCFELCVSICGVKDHLSLAKTSYSYWYLHLSLNFYKLCPCFSPSSFLHNIHILIHSFNSNLLSAYTLCQALFQVLGMEVTKAKFLSSWNLYGGSMFFTSSTEISRNQLWESSLQKDI